MWKIFVGIACFFLILFFSGALSAMQTEQQEAQLVLPEQFYKDQIEFWFTYEWLERKDACKTNFQWVFSCYQKVMVVCEMICSELKCYCRQVLPSVKDESPFAKIKLVNKQEFEKRFWEVPSQTRNRYVEAVNSRCAKIWNKMLSDV